MDDLLSSFNEKTVISSHTQTNKYCYVKAMGILTPNPNT